MQLYACAVEYQACLSSDHSRLYVLYHCTYTLSEENQEPQTTQSAGPVRFLIFCSISIFLLASPVAGKGPIVLLGHRSRKCTPPYLFPGNSNMLQPAQAEVVLGHLSMYLASWKRTTSLRNKNLMQLTILCNINPLTHCTFDVTRLTADL